MPFKTVTVAVTVRISPLRRLVNKGISEVGPPVTVGVFAAPTVATCGRADGGSSDAGANVRRGSTGIVTAAITVSIVPL